MKLLSWIILLSIQLIFLNPACALDIKYRNEFLKDVRSDDGNIYLNRISLYKNIAPLNVEISGFGEAQWNIKTQAWEKITAGFEAKKHLFEYFYFGESLQFISGKILDYYGLNKFIGMYFFIFSILIHTRKNSKDKFISYSI